MSIDVLIVEDDPMVMEIVASYVNSIDGFRVAAQAGGGKEALTEMAAKPIGLIVLDVHLPVMSGIEFLTALRTRGDSADVIFLTASNDTHVISQALQLGAVDYLIKPFTYERFKAAFENYLRRVRILRQDGETTQEQLDQVFGQPVASGLHIQKGLHPKTLESIRSYICSQAGDRFSQSDIAQTLGLSKVTVRKYMEYLVSINEIIFHIEYGSIGRPTHIYRKSRQ